MTTLNLKFLTQRSVRSWLLTFQHSSRIRHFIVNISRMEDLFAISASLATILDAIIPCFTSSTLDSARCSLDIASVRITTGTAGILQGDCRIIFPADFENFSVTLVEGIFLTGHAHPCEHKGAAAGDYVHLPFVLSEPFDGFTCDAEVQDHEIHASSACRRTTLMKSFAVSVARSRWYSHKLQICEADSDKVLRQNTLQIT